MDTILIDGINHDLNSLEIDIWNRLLNGSLRYKDPFHNPVVANTCRAGISMRTVVVRKVWPFKKELAFHTDIRSGKWSDLQTNPAISWLFYNPQARMQVRLAGCVVLHYDDLIADEAWAACNMSSRKIYMGPEAPSHKVLLPTSGLPESLEISDPSIDERAAGRKNFSVVVTKVNWMEWLWLNSKGHRRASFAYNSNGSFSANWLVP